MRTERLYLDNVRERIKELQEFEKRLEQALTKEYEDISEDEHRSIWREHERLIGRDEEIDADEVTPEDLRIFDEVMRNRGK
jgi:hypothetical protein